MWRRQVIIGGWAGTPPGSCRHVVYKVMFGTDCCSVAGVCTYACVCMGYHCGGMWLSAISTPIPTSCRGMSHDHWYRHFVSESHGNTPCCSHRVANRGHHLPMSASAPASSSIHFGGGVVPGRGATKIPGMLVADSARCQPSVSRVSGVGSE